jgi:tetratricopeptide (TPR) repeat protein
VVGTNVLEELVHVVVLALPVAVLLLLLALLQRGLRRRAREAASVSDRSAPGRQPEQGAGIAPGATPAASAAGESGGAALLGETAGGLPTLDARIQSALASGALPALAPLYLELARRQAAQGDQSARMAALRSAAGYGALHGPKSAHAEARMELAEAAYGSGDLTSACEQWQLARTAFQEAGQGEAHARVERRMRENGCPTDWVLTDF